MDLIKQIKTKVKKLIIHTYGPSIVHYMASTGDKTNECMDIGCLPVLTNFYQPIPDLKDLERRNVFDKVSYLRGLIWDPPKHLENLRELSTFADECEWPNEPDAEQGQFYLNNGRFSYGCASILHCLIRKNKPSRIIEIGSGYSSRVIAAALLANIAEDNQYTPEYTIIDPYSPIDISKFPFPKNTKLLKTQVETVDLSVFQELQANDILFIDSSHVSKIGSDVNFEILEILPVLNNGVYIHFHDIELPYEYSKVYATNPKFRVFWTEAYLLQAFLSYNRHYEIFLPVCYIQRNHKEEFKTLYKKGNNAALWGSGSFWIKCVKENPI